MNFHQIERIVKHLQGTCVCLQCKNKYNLEDIHIIATTKIEGLFETHCKKCGCSTIVTVFLAKAPEIKEAKIRKPLLNRKHGEISQDDILDIKNFLSNFNGDFKKIFHNQNL